MPTTPGPAVLSVLRRCRQVARYARSYAVVVGAASLGLSVGAIPQVQALYAGAGYYSNLYEMSGYGNEKVSSMIIYGWSSDWYACNGVNCTSTADRVSVTWNINDGSSTFEKIFGRYYADAWCPSQTTSVTVNAGPGNPSGTRYAYFGGGACTVGYGIPWIWAAGMCDTSADCYWNTARGPHISWTWSPPGGSAFNFQYFWVR